LNAGNLLAREECNVSSFEDPQNVDFRDLSVLALVHKLKSVTQAAEELGVNQSAVSYTLKKLRAVFKDPLFVRQARQLMPTARCDDIVRKCAQITSDFRELAQPTEFDPQTVTQKFTIACNYYERALFIPTIVHALRTKAPLLNLEIADAQGKGHERLQNNEADLLIGPFEREDPYFYRRELYQDGYVCLLDPAHPNADGPLSLDDYLRLDHVVVTYGGQWRSRYLLELEEQGLDIKIALRVPSPAGIDLLVAGSNLVATVPGRLSGKFGGHLKVVGCPLATTVKIRLVWTAFSHRSPLHMWVREQIYQLISSAAAESETLV
jgi:DNA-binding transcriptional LysR family regulator